MCAIGAGSAIDGVALQGAVGIEGEVFQNGRVAGTVLIAVQRVLDYLDVELSQAIQGIRRNRIVGAIAGNGEVKGVLVADLIFDFNIGSGFQDLLGDIFENTFHFVGIRGAFAVEEIILTTGNTRQNGFRHIVILIVGITTVCLRTGRRLLLQDQANRIDSNIVSLHQAGPVFSGQCICECASIYRGIARRSDVKIIHDRAFRNYIRCTGGIIGRTAIRHKHAELLAIIVFSSCIVWEICRFGRLQQIVTSFQRNIVICTGSSRTTIKLISQICIQRIQLCLAVNRSQGATNIICIRNIIGGITVEIAYVDTVIVEGSILIFDNRFNKCLRSSNGRINAIGVHRSGLVKHNHHIHLGAGGEGHAGHGKLNLRDTGFGIVTDRGSGLVETDSAFVGVLREIVGAITGNHIQRIGGGNDDGIRAEDIAILIQIVGSNREGAVVLAGEGDHAGSSIDGGNALVGNRPEDTAVIHVAKVFTILAVITNHTVELLDDRPDGIGIASHNALQGNRLGDQHVRNIAIFIRYRLVQFDGIVRCLCGNLDIVIDGIGSAVGGPGIGNLDQSLAVHAGEGDFITAETAETADNAVGIAAFHDGIADGAAQLCNFSCSQGGGSGAAVGREGDLIAQLSSGTVDNHLADLSRIAGNGIGALYGGANRNCLQLVIVNIIVAGSIIAAAGGPGSIVAINVTIASVGVSIRRVSTNSPACAAGSRECQTAAIAKIVIAVLALECHAGCSIPHDRLVSGFDPRIRDGIGSCIDRNAGAGSRILLQRIAGSGGIGADKNVLFACRGGRYQNINILFNSGCVIHILGLGIINSDINAIAYHVVREVVGLEGYGTVTVVGCMHVGDGLAIIRNIVNNGILHAAGDRHGDNNSLSIIVAVQGNVIGHVVVDQVRNGRRDGCVGGSNIFDSNVGNTGYTDFRGNTGICIREYLSIHGNAEGGGQLSVRHLDSVGAGSGHIKRVHIDDIAIGIVILLINKDRLNKIFSAVLFINGRNSERSSDIQAFAHQILGSGIGNGDRIQYITIRHNDVAIGKQAGKGSGKLNKAGTGRGSDQFVGNHCQSAVVSQVIHAQIGGGHIIHIVDGVLHGIAGSIALKGYIQRNIVAEGFVKASNVAGLVQSRDAGQAKGSGGYADKLIIIPAGYRVFSLDQDFHLIADRNSVIRIGVDQRIGAGSGEGSAGLHNIVCIHDGAGQIAELEIAFGILLDRAIAVGNNRLGRIGNRFTQYVRGIDSDFQALGAIGDNAGHGAQSGIAGGSILIECNGGAVNADQHSLTVAAGLGQVAGGGVCIINSSFSTVGSSVGGSLFVIHNAQIVLQGQAGGAGGSDIALDAHLGAGGIVVLGGIHGVVVAMEEYDITDDLATAFAAGSNFIQRVVPVARTAIIAAIGVDGLMRHQNDRLGGIDVCTIGPRHKGSCGGFAVAALQIALDNAIDIIVVAFIQQAGSLVQNAGIVIAVHVMAVGIHDIHAGVVQIGRDSRNLAQNGRRLIRTGAVHHVAAKIDVLNIAVTDNAFHLCQQFADDIGVPMPVCSKEQILCGIHRKDGHGHQANDHSQAQQHGEHTLRCHLLHTHLPFL